MRCSCIYMHETNSLCLADNQDTAVQIGTFSYRLADVQQKKKVPLTSALTPLLLQSSQTLTSRVFASLSLFFPIFHSVI